MSNDNPVALRFCIWYFVAIHFVDRGCEFHHPLSISSLNFEKNEKGIEDVTISKKKHKKNTKVGGGVEETNEEANDKRMYATGTPFCQVQSLKPTQNVYLIYARPLQK